MSDGGLRVEAYAVGQRVAAGRRGAGRKAREDGGARETRETRAPRETLSGIGVSSSPDAADAGLTECGLP
ncbi:hypothetical protein [Actinacidiphila alni]|uniref:hypothetical protein n=1 Tax=Actinacidiphila alni TaxID=380248 RepID=UPI003452E76D